MISTDHHMTSQESNTMNFHTATYSVTPRVETGKTVRTVFNLITPRRTAMTASTPFVRSTFRLSCIAALVGLAAGCSSTPLADQIAEVEEKRQEKLVDVRDQTQDNIPDWYLENVEASSNRLLFGRGTARSTDLQTAIDLAMYLAHLEIGRAANVQVSEIMKSHRSVMIQDEQMNMLVDTTSERYVVPIDTGPSRIVKREIKPEGVGFRAFVLLSMDVDESVMRRNAQIAMDKAHAELMARNAEYRAAAAAASAANAPRAPLPPAMPAVMPAAAPAMAPLSERVP
jgi:hypothetical protein